jgi:hypothetical protein
MSRKKLSFLTPNNDREIQSRLFLSNLVGRPSSQNLRPSLDVANPNHDHLSEKLENAWHALSDSAHGRQLKEIFDTPPINLGLWGREREDNGGTYLNLSFVGSDQNGIIPPGSEFVSSYPAFFRTEDGYPFLSDADYVAILANLTTQAVAKARACQYAENLKGDLSVHLACHRLANITRVYQLCQILHELEDQYRTSSRLNEYALNLMPDQADRIKWFLNGKQRYDASVFNENRSPSDGEGMFPSMFDKIVFYRLMMDPELKDDTDAYAMKLFTFGDTNKAAEFLKPRESYSDTALITSILGYPLDGIDENIFQPDSRNANINLFQQNAFDQLSINGPAIWDSSFGHDYNQDDIFSRLWTPPSLGAVFMCGGQIKSGEITQMVNNIYNAYPSVDGSKILSIMNAFAEGQCNLVLNIHDLSSLDGLDFENDILPYLSDLTQPGQGHDDAAELSDYFMPELIEKASPYPG